MENQQYREYRLLELPSGLLSPGDRYYIPSGTDDSGDNVFDLYVVGDDGLPRKQRGMLSWQELKLNGIENGAQVNPQFKTIGGVMLVGDNSNIPVATINGQMLINSSNNIVLPGNSGGVATPTTPATPNNQLWYSVTNSTGAPISYANFGGVIVPAETTGRIQYDFSSNSFVFLEDTSVNLSGYATTGDLASYTPLTTTNQISEAVFTTDYTPTPLPDVSSESGALVGTTGNVSVVAGYTTKRYDVTGLTQVSLNGRSGSGNFCLAVAYNGGGTMLGAFEIGATADYSNHVVTLPFGAAYVKVTGTVAVPAGAGSVVATVVPKFYEKGETYTRAQSNALLSDKVDNDDFYEQEYTFTDIPDNGTEAGILVSTTGSVYNVAGYTTKRYNVSAQLLAVSGRSAGGNYCLAIAYSSGNAVLQAYFVGQSTNYSRYVITLPYGTAYVKVSGNDASPAAAATVTVAELPKFFTKQESDARYLDPSSDNFWKGKRIWWCGTSIPARGYPQQTGLMLGATIYNVALPSSFARANVRTGDYVNAMRENVLRGLTRTKEEQQYLIDNWATIRSVLYGSPSDDLTPQELATMATSTFEDKLIPYLDGTLPMPDLFVIDHGHNDWKTFYQKQDGTPDIDLVPDRGLELNGQLAEDTFMRANSFSKLASFMGDLSKVANISTWAARLNRNTFIGAVNFLCTLILRYNPRARIMFVSNNRRNKQLLIEAQQYNSDNWLLPICRVDARLGYSSNVIPGTSDYWGDSRPNDITVFDVYNQDGVHPSANQSDASIQIYAGVIAEFIKTVR